VKREILERLQVLRQQHQSVVLVTRLADGVQSFVTENNVEGELNLLDDTVTTIRQRMNEDLSGVVFEEDNKLFVRVYSKPLRLILVGAVHVSQALIPMAALLGFEVTVIDPRSSFASDERFPEVKTMTDWPDQAIRTLKPDLRTAVVTLTHDPKLDDPALIEVLPTNAFYIGSLGSKGTHASRLERLRAEGIDAKTLSRIHAPVGLHLGGRRPAEIALSIMAEIIQTLRLSTSS
jgi:xanthine dehydrogenase accessory factor